MGATCMIAVSCNTVALKAAQVESSGFWSDNTDWPVEEQTDSGKAYCIATTKPFMRGEETVQVSLLVSQPSEVRLISDHPIKSTKEAAIELPGGVGLDFMDQTVRKSGKSYVAINVITSPMMRDLVGDMRTAKSAVFVTNGRGYFLPVSDFEATYQDLVKCERHRAGLILGD